MTLNSRLVTLALFALTGNLLAGAPNPNNRQLIAVPLPGKVVIDGNLDDWDLSGSIEVFVSPVTRDKRNAKVAVMYDDEAIYLSGRVKDSTPMLNRYDPRAMADKAWKPDVCQFRLATDPAVRADTPLDEFRIKDGFQSDLERDQPVQLQMWYYSDEKQPALMVTKSFKYQPLRAEWAPHGVVPSADFQAAYRKDDDGQGYVFEYRVPWATLNAGKVHPKAGQQVPANLQIHWGDETGLESAAAGWAYDLMSKAGFPFQTMDCWGTLYFSPTGNLAPTLTGSETTPVAEPTPLEFRFDVPEDSELTLSLYNESNQLVRHLLAQEFRPKGPQVLRWNGLDENGKPLPAGTYTWKGIYHEPLKTRYVMSVGNSGKPGWKTADGKGGWGGDYGPPMDIKTTDDGLVITWQSGEAGPSLIGTDREGNKQWGLTHRHSNFLASDGHRFVAAPHNKVELFEAASGKPMAFGNGRPQLEPAPGGTDSAAAKVTGLAWHGGRIYVSDGPRNAIAVYEGDSGKWERTIEIPAPGRLVGWKTDELLAISGNEVRRINAKGESQPFLKAHLDQPAGIAVDAAGTIFVANHGALQNVSVFSPAGKYLRSIGIKGGRPLVGRFNQAGMLKPGGIAITPNGELWVPESINSPKRVSVWDAKSGKFLKEFFGANSYSPSAWMDPANATELFHDDNIWKIDLDQGTWEPFSTFYRPTQANQLGSGGGGFFYPFRTVTAENGQQYGFSVMHGFGTVIWIREGDQFRPLHYLFRNYPNPQLGFNQAFDILKDRKAYPSDVTYHWADRNGDQIAQVEEITRLPQKLAPHFWLDAKLRIRTTEGWIFTPQSVDAKGVPTYEFSQSEKWLDFKVDQLWTNPAGTEIFSFSTQSAGPSTGLAGWSPAGERKWSTLPIPNWARSLNYPQVKKGPLFGPTAGLGVAGDFTGVTRYFSFYEIFRKDGLYVGRVLQPNVLGGHGPDTLYIEFLYGQMVKPDGMDRYFLIGGDQDVRVLEVLGLNTVRDLPGGKWTLTPELAATARGAWDHYQKQLSGRQPLEIVAGGLAGLQSATPIKGERDGGRSFAAAAAYDAENVYVRYDVKSPAKLVNAIPDPQVVFKGGNLLDIQLATDPKAAANRKNPAVGDLRLLISRQKGQPHAVLFRPKVAGGNPEPVKLASPTGSETFESIEVTPRVKLLEYQETAEGFSVIAQIPLDVLGWKPEPGKTVKMDLGYIFGNSAGAQAATRAYWANRSFTANVLNDIPHESRIEPLEWGEAEVKNSR